MLAAIVGAATVTAAALHRNWRRDTDCGGQQAQPPKNRPKLPVSGMPVILSSLSVVR
jgi:hypothetical protein